MLLIPHMKKEWQNMNQICNCILLIWTRGVKQKKLQKETRAKNQQYSWINIPGDPTAKFWADSLH